MRSRWRKQAAPLDAAVAGSKEDETSYASLMPSSIPAPDDSLSNLETRQAVQKIVDQMPENLRVVLLLSYFHEFPYKEIAEMLNVPLGTVKSRLHAALKHFAKQWKEQVEREGHVEQKTEETSLMMDFLLGQMDQSEEKSFRERIETEVRLQSLREDVANTLKALRLLPDIEPPAHLAERTIARIRQDRQLKTLLAHQESVRRPAGPMFSLRELAPSPPPLS